MADDFSLIKEKIIAHPYFQKAKDVIENNSCHDHQSVYDHLLLTANRAEKATRGEFITNQEAKVLFQQWLDEEIFGMGKRDVAIITALVHDIGKIFSYKENGKVYSIVKTREDGTTFIPGHEYWGATIVPKMLTDVGLSDKLANHIAELVRLHTFQDIYAPIFSSIPMQKFLEKIKSQENWYKESLLNSYADVQSCFPEWIEFVKKVFNEPGLYREREYFVER